MPRIPPYDSTRLARIVHTTVTRKPVMTYSTDNFPVVPHPPDESPVSDAAIRQEPLPPHPIPHGFPTPAIATHNLSCPIYSVPNICALLEYPYEKAPVSPSLLEESVFHATDTVHTASTDHRPYPIPNPCLLPDIHEATPYQHQTILQVTPLFCQKVLPCPTLQDFRHKISISCEYFALHSPNNNSYFSHNATPVHSKMQTSYRHQSLYGTAIVRPLMSYSTTPYTPHRVEYTNVGMLPVPCSMPPSASKYHPCAPLASFHVPTSHPDTSNSNSVYKIWILSDSLPDKYKLRNSRSAPVWYVGALPDFFAAARPTRSAFPS